MAPVKLKILVYLNNHLFLTVNVQLHIRYFEINATNSFPYKQQQIQAPIHHRQ